MRPINRTVLACALLFASPALPAVGEEAAPEPPPSVHRPDASPEEVLSQCVQFFRVGYSDKNSPFQIGWRIPRDGWEPVVRDVHAKVLRDTGAHWLWLHNPFGAEAGKIMQFTSRVRLLDLAEQGDQGARRVEETFLPTMRRLLKGDYTNGRRVGIVCYFGNAATDETLKPLLAEVSLERWQQLWELSIEPVRRLAAEFPRQVMFGADSIEELPADHPYFELLKHLHENGLPVIGEPRFLASRPHLFDFGMIKVWRQDGGGFDRSDPARFRGRVPLARNDQILGPRFALYRKSRENAIESGEMSIGHLRNALRAGATPVLDMRAMIKQVESDSVRKK